MVPVGLWSQGLWRGFNGHKLFLEAFHKIPYQKLPKGKYVRGLEKDPPVDSGLLKNGMQRTQLSLSRVVPSEVLSALILFMSPVTWRTVTDAPLGFFRLSKVSVSKNCRWTSQNWDRSKKGGRSPS